MNKKVFGYLLAILVIGTMIVLMVKSNLETPKPVKKEADVGNIEVGLGPGNLPPDFELSTLSGESVKLSDLHGKKVILNFWASWCGPCKAEMPHMEKYYENNKDAANVEIIAVNLTTSERSGLKGIEEFVHEYGLTFPILLDKEGIVGQEYRIITIPTTFLLRTNGTIAHKITGPMDEKMMSDLVDNME